MDHWRMAYLGIRQVPRELSEFELNTFFTFSRRELASIDSRRSDLYRLAMALHVAFIRMTGRTLDSYKQIPTVLLRHLGRQLGIQSPDVGTLRSIYDGNLKTLSDHQRFAQTVVNFRSIAEHQRRYVIRWLKEQLTGRPERGQLMSELKRWFYEHRIVIPPDRMLRQFIVQAVRDIEALLHETLQQSLGEERLDSWARLLPLPHGDHSSLQRWLWAVPLRGSTHQMGEVLDKINLLTMYGVAANWPAGCNDAIVRHYARRCASRPPSISKRIEPHGRRLEAACFMRYALCTSTDQVLSMLRRWVQKAVNDASHTVDAARVKAADQLHEFAVAVKALATDDSLSHETLRIELCVLADQVLQPHTPNRRSQIRQRLILRRHSARNLLMRLVQLPFEAEAAHPVLDAIVLLRGLYRRHVYLLPNGVNVWLGRAWREAIDGYDRLKAMIAFEWATLFALRVALRNGTIFVQHSFSFRSQTHMLIPAEEWPTRRNNLYGHLGLPQDPKEFLDPVLAHLDQRLELLRQAVDDGKVRIDTAVHLNPLQAQPESAETDQLRRAIFEVHPPGQLPEIILEIDSATRFSWGFAGT